MTVTRIPASLRNPGVQATCRSVADDAGVPPLLSAQAGSWPGRSEFRDGASAGGKVEVEVGVVETGGGNGGIRGFGVNPGQLRADRAAESSGRNQRSGAVGVVALVRDGVGLEQVHRAAITKQDEGRAARKGVAPGRFPEGRWRERPGPGSAGR